MPVLEARVIFKMTTFCFTPGVFYILTVHRIQAMAVRVIIGSGYRESATKVGQDPKSPGLSPARQLFTHTVELGAGAKGT